MLQPNLNFNYQYERNLKCDLFLDALIKIKNLSLRLPNPPFFCHPPKTLLFLSPPPPHMFFFMSPLGQNSLCHPHFSQIVYVTPLYVTPQKFYVTLYMSPQG